MQRLAPLSWERIWSKRVMGCGELATVYLIHNIRRNTTVARKVLNECNANARKALEMEVKLQRLAASAALAPRIVNHNAKRCTVDMEPAGISLREVCVLNSGKLTRDEQNQIIWLIDQMVDRKINHMDMHACNILWATTHFVAIDFANGSKMYPQNMSVEERTFEKGTKLHGLLYSPQGGLVSKGFLKHEPAHLVRQMRKWGLEKPGTRRKRPSAK